jgi:hypothetical protein
MPRTPGALNRPKYINVSVADIKRVFGDGAVIQIASHYAHFFYCNQTNFTEVPQPVREQKIEPPIPIQEIE